MEENYIRLAAIIDCEGWISIISKGQASKGCKLVLQLGVGNTNHKLITWLKDTFGGSECYNRRDSVRHKNYWNWRVYGKTAMELLSRCLPWLLLKAEQARLAIHFQETMHHGSTAYTAAYGEYMVSLKKKMNWLNRKGKTISPATTERDNTSESSEATV